MHAHGCVSPPDRKSLIVSSGEEEANMQSHQSAAIGERAGWTGRATTVVPALIAAFVGVFLIWSVGFSQVSAVHNAAHDTRHSNAFPCH
jgi:cobalt transporter subunit CbtB